MLRQEHKATISQKHPAPHLHGRAGLINPLSKVQISHTPDLDISVSINPPRASIARSWFRLSSTETGWYVSNYRQAFRAYVVETGSVRCTSVEDSGRRYDEQWL
jgi:hypothetical protein